MRVVSGKSFPGTASYPRTPGVILLVKDVKTILAKLAALTIKK